MDEKKNNTDALTVNIGPANKTLSIFLISVLGLFLEMMLIRWIGTEIRIFAYLQNTILVVCFLGIGLGCFSSNQKINMNKMIITLLVLTLLLAIPVIRKALGQISELLALIGDIPIFYGVSVDASQTIFYILLGLALSYFVILIILDIFVPIGRILGRLLDNHPNIIWAYSINIAGSLFGTWLFVFMSSLYAPPVLWCSVVIMILLFFLNEPGRIRIINFVLCFCLLVASWFAGIEAGSLEVVWSPYQKLVLRETKPEKGEAGKYLVNVNNVRYQEMVDLTEAVKDINSTDLRGSIKGYSQYDLQLLLHPNPQKMLIVGAGTGNDVAGGLQHGAKEIVAVEIDPAILSMGQRYHPLKPYDSPIVKIVNDDARSYFAISNDRFDVISFALLDSHTTSVMTNTRLDEYVFTKESIERAKSLLADGGIIFLHFGPQRYYIADRLAHILLTVFNEEPMSFYIPKSEFGLGGMMFVAGNLTGARSQINKDPTLKALIDNWRQRKPVTFTYKTVMSTDDWPYLYLEDHRVPILYYLLAGTMLILFFRSCKHWEISNIFSQWERSHWHFFFLGAAFMLLEVQNISKAAVVLGSTWEVNAVIVSGVLVMILLANLLTLKFPNIPLMPVYIILCIICLSLYYIDLASFAFLPYFPKAVLIGSLTTLPMLFSGIIFIRSFARMERKNQALGANLFGALIGGLLQSVTFIIGIKALLLIVVGLYVLSLLTLPRMIPLMISKT